MITRIARSARAVLASSLSVVFLTMPVQASEEVSGEETVIHYASNGGIRDYREGEKPGVLYMRDARERWYRVTLTGDCLKGSDFQTLRFTTDSLGTFDTFSSVVVARHPETVCGVTKIVRSPSPELAAAE